jgi:hypothetical protein
MKMLLQRPGVLVVWIIGALFFLLRCGFTGTVDALAWTLFLVVAAPTGKAIQRYWNSASRSWTDLVVILFMGLVAVALLAYVVTAGWDCLIEGPVWPAPR